MFQTLLRFFWGFFFFFFFFWQQRRGREGLWQGEWWLVLKGPDLYNVFTAGKADLLLVLRLFLKGPFLLLFYFLGSESRSLYKGQKSLSGFFNILERIGADIGSKLTEKL